MQPSQSVDDGIEKLNDPSKSMSMTRLCLMVGLTLYAIAFGGTAMRIVPGGPFFSMSADILPVVASITAMLIGLTAFRTKQTHAKLLAIISIAICCLAITNVVTDVMWFWIRPAARGDLIGF